MLYFWTKSLYFALFLVNSDRNETYMLAIDRRLSPDAIYTPRKPETRFIIQDRNLGLRFEYYDGFCLNNLRNMESSINALYQATSNTRTSYPCIAMNLRIWRELMHHEFATIFCLRQFFLRLLFLWDISLTPATDEHLSAKRLTCLAFLPWASVNDLYIQHLTLLCFSYVMHTYASARIHAHTHTYV